MLSADISRKVFGRITGNEVDSSKKEREDTIMFKGLFGKILIAATSRIYEDSTYSLGLAKLNLRRIKNVNKSRKNSLKRRALRICRSA